MVQEFGGRVAFASENYGESELARRNGVTRYPAIFVDDVLVATPKDFGFYGTGEGKGQGRYTPLKSVESHERFRADLTRMLDLELAGKKAEARSVARPARDGEIAKLPAVAMRDLDGRPIAPADLAGRAVIVEFWATWCPPCRGTLAWIGGVKQRYGDRLAVVTVAVESDSARVHKIADELHLPVRWVVGTPELASAFGDVSAVPTLMLFGPDGRLAKVFCGATPTLHADAESRLASILGAR